MPLTCAWAAQSGASRYLGTTVSRLTSSGSAAIAPGCFMSTLATPAIDLNWTWPLPCTRAVSQRRGNVSQGS